MMLKLYKKNETLFAVMLIIAYVVLMSAADAFSEGLGTKKLLTAPLSVAVSVLLLIWIMRSGLAEKYGLYAFTGSLKSLLFFIPLAVIMSCNLWNGVCLNYTLTETILYVISMLCVGFLEEVIFRGLLFKAMCRDNVKVAVLVSSLTFGMGHVVNLLNGAQLLETLLQMCYAFAIGFLFVVIFLASDSLWPCIIAHGVINSLSAFAVDASSLIDIITAAVLCVVSLSYAFYLWKRCNLTERCAMLGDKLRMDDEKQAI